jgi:YidC/Oxa1 family membrane protein insertase
MDRRTVLALVLVAAVIVFMPRLFPGRPRVQPPGPDSSAPGRGAAGAPPATPGVTASPELPPAPAIERDTSTTRDSVLQAPVATVDTVTLSDSLVRYRFISLGGALDEVELSRYRALGGGAGSVRLTAPASPLLQFRGIAGRDTIHFNRVSFSTTAGTATAQSVEFRGAVGADSMTLRYTAVPDSFVIRVNGTVSGRLSAESGGFVLLDLPTSLVSFEADSVDDQRHLAFAYMQVDRDAKGVGFGKLDPGERVIAPGPHAWVALKSKYFIVGVLAADERSEIAEFLATGLPRTSRVATEARGTAVLRAVGGSFALTLYTGPQQWHRLRTIGGGFENSNPYGGWLQPIVQPFATLVLRVLLWMHEKLAMSYGWVLVAFGVVVRLVLWPLNQRAMRASIKMQRIQPELQELQKRYKSDPQKLQAEMMRVYKEHGMSPFSMFSGCLPLLLPMPILFALFFVFQSTIEFRGVPFLWLSDISQKDPYYILPIVMGLSMYVLTWIGSRNTPPNPQTKMMGYIFPVMMTFLLANLAAGLNLYYAVQNVAALPQQWLIANERARSSPGAKPGPGKK